jgi:hypothetical protein
MPRRGDLDVGQVTLMDFFDLDEVVYIYQGFFKKHGTNLDNWPARTSTDKRVIKRLKWRTSGRLTMGDMSRAFQDPEALADFRKMNGTAFDPMAKAIDYEMMERQPPKCNFSMKELFL